MTRPYTTRDLIEHLKVELTLPHYQPNTRPRLELALRYLQDAIKAPTLEDRERLESEALAILRDLHLPL